MLRVYFDYMTTEKFCPATQKPSEPQANELCIVILLCLVLREHNKKDKN